MAEEENPPDPTPGLTRIPTFWEVLAKALPKRSSWDTELLLLYEVCWKDRDDVSSIPSNTEKMNIHSMSTAFSSQGPEILFRYIILYTKKQHIITYQQLILTPILTNSSKSTGNSCELKLIFSAGTPISMALLTSKPLLASMQIPLLTKYLRMVPLGEAFMAYRTVNPYALGKARQSSADLASVSRE